MQTNPMSIFNDNLRAALTARSLTITEFAEQIGMQREALSKIINGRVDPTTGTLNRIAEGLGTNLHELFRPEEEATPKKRRKNEVQAA